MNGPAAGALAPADRGGSYARPILWHPSTPVIRTLLAVALLALPLCAGSALAQPQPLAFENTIAAARDVPYPGTMKLAVDATDLERRIFRVRADHPRRRAGPDDAALSRSGCPATTRRAAHLTSVAGLMITRRRQGRALAPRPGRRLRLPRRRAGRAPASSRSSSSSCRRPPPTRAAS